MTSCQGNVCVGEGCLGQQSPETVANCLSELLLASRESVSACPVTQPTATLMIPAEDRVSLDDTNNHPDLKALTLFPVTQNECVPSRAIQARSSPVIS